MEAAAQKELDSFYGPDGPVAAKVVMVGDPAIEITRFASANNVDLIMMATHGYGKFRNLLLGSVASKVLHDASCAVWTAAHAEDPDLSKHLPCKNIMAAVDIAPGGVDLIRHYAKLAEDLGAKTWLVHALPDASADLRYGLDPQFRTYIADSSRRQLAKMQSEAGTDFEVCLAEGPVSKVVCAAAAHHDADLVLLGRDTLKSSFGQLRTNSYAIIRDSPCPVLSV
jgi:nucleotide-binding universal stress UspA family protein